MKMNLLQPSKGANQARTRVGRGLGKKGKTCGWGYKGQKARGRGKVRAGFESGHVSLLNRIPKFGFVSRKSLTAESLPMMALNTIDEKKYTQITLDVLVELNMISSNTTSVKFYLKGELRKAAFHLKGIRVTKSVLELIEKAGGSVSDG